MVLAPHTDLLPKLELKPGRWTVGSAPTCSYRISGSDVQPRHALLLCGRQSVVLRAWDAHTWHNGQPVQGEVRLQPGDRLKVGSVEFSIEVEASRDHDSTTTTPIATAAAVPDGDRDSLAEEDSNGWIALHEQIQQLRAELSQLGFSRTDAISEWQNQLRDAQQAAHAHAERVAELERLAAEARQQSEHFSAELLALREEYARREQSWAEQQAEWSHARELWQLERQALQDQLQQRTAEWEAQQADIKAEASRWQSECEQLQAELRQHITQVEEERAEWLAEKSQWLGEKSAIEQAHQAERDAHARREVEHLERLQELIEERRQLDESRQQLADAQQSLESERQTLAAERERLAAERKDLAAEREHWQLQVADAQEKLDALTRDRENLARERAELARERQALEHSWNWLHADRRAVADEKDQWEQLRSSWQTEREAWLAEKSRLEKHCEELLRERSEWSDLQQAQEQLLAERQRLQGDLDQFRNEREAWRKEQARIEAEHQARQIDIEQAELRVQERQRALLDEQQQLQVARAEFDKRLEEFDRQAALNPSTTETVRSTHDLWDSTSELESFQAADAASEAVAGPDADTNANDESWDSMSDHWSVGVDLTAPRDIHDYRTNTDTENKAKPANESPAAALPVANIASEPIGDDAAALPAMEDDRDANDHDAADGAVADASKPALASPSAQQSDWPAPPSPARFTIPSVSDVDPNLVALREQLADVFNLPGLKSTPTVPPSDSASPASLQLTEIEPPRAEFQQETVRDVEPAATTSDSISESFPSTENLFEPPRHVSDTSAELSPSRKFMDEEPAAKSSGSSSLSPLSELSFSDDEPIEDSVSRYMQLLLARSNKAAEQAQQFDTSGTARSTPPRLAPQTVSGESAAMRSNTCAATLSTSTAPTQQNAETPQADPATASSAAPGSKLSKDALRNVTEQMRQVANQQTLRNVQAANRNRLLSSLKTKLLLAALAFSLSAGLLYLGYNHKPDFLPLGVCALGLGIMTWLDLFLGIRAARARMAQLTGRKSQKSKTKA